MTRPQVACIKNPRYKSCTCRWSNHNMRDHSRSVKPSDYDTGTNFKHFLWRCGHLTWPDDLTSDDLASFFYFYKFFGINVQIDMPSLAALYTRVFELLMKNRWRGAIKANLFSNGDRPEVPSTKNLANYNANEWTSFIHELQSVTVEGIGGHAKNKFKL